MTLEKQKDRDMRNYENLIKNIQNRTNPDFIDETQLFESEFRKGLGQPSYRKVLEYVKRAMHGVEPRYTERTLEAGNKVKEHLKSNNPSLDFKYQGSVMTNTHIKGHSDIDLLQITNMFYYPDNRLSIVNAINSINYTQLQKIRLNTILSHTSYQGNENNDLKGIRIEAEQVLQRNYKYVDVNKSKSIEVKPTNPPRKVDVVTASWYKNIKSIANDDVEERGIRIFDKNSNTILPVDYPFRKIRLVNEKDKSVNGRLKKMIRFIKNVKADSEYKIDLSSFDITSICYDIPINFYFDKSYFELVAVIYNQFLKIYEDSFYRNTLMSVDGTEPIFKNKEDKLSNLALLAREIDAIKEDIYKDTPNVPRFI